MHMPTQVYVSTSIDRLFIHLISTYLLIQDNQLITVIESLAYH